jgi:hypothetical protein
VATWASLLPPGLLYGHLGLRKAFLTFLFEKLSLFFGPFFLLLSGLSFRLVYVLASAMAK